MTEFDLPTSFSTPCGKTLLSTPTSSLDPLPPKNLDPPPPFRQFDHCLYYPYFLSNYKDLSLSKLQTTHSLQKPFWTDLVVSSYSPLHRAFSRGARSKDRGSDGIAVRILQYESPSICCYSNVCLAPRSTLQCQLIRDENLRTDFKKQQ